MTTNDKIKLLFEFGEAKRNRDWQDYLKYGFDETDVPALLELVADDALNYADAESKDVWVPLHAWRTLGQIGSHQAVTPLIFLFDQLVGDDWAISELPIVMGMIGESAITPVCTYLKETQHDTYARAMSADALAKIVKHYPTCREQVIQCFQDYMSHPDESDKTLNGLLICHLLDIDATETINDIRQLFEKNCVDISCAGDLDEVEIELGFRTERATPKPNFSQLLYGIDDLAEMKKHDNENVLEVIDYYLMQYGHDDSILDVSEMEGFFAALACAPHTIKPSLWMPVIWGGEALTPEWQNKKELETFSQAVFTLYNQVMQSLNDNDFEALFLEDEAEDETLSSVDDCCEGFLRGVNLWGPQPAKETAFIEEHLQAIRLFATEAGFEQLASMSKEEEIIQQQLIESNVRRLYQHFLEQRIAVTQSVVRDSPKVGRNDPCPCGSGKKFKKCCLH